MLVIQNGAVRQATAFVLQDFDPAIFPRIHCLLLLLLVKYLIADLGPHGPEGRNVATHDLFVQLLEHV